MFTAKYLVSIAFTCVALSACGGEQISLRTHSDDAGSNASVALDDDDDEKKTPDFGGGPQSFIEVTPKFVLPAGVTLTEEEYRSIQIISLKLDFYQKAYGSEFFAGGVDESDVCAPRYGELGGFETFWLGRRENGICLDTGGFSKEYPVKILDREPQNSTKSLRGVLTRGTFLIAGKYYTAGGECTWGSIFMCKFKLQGTKSNGL